MGDTTPISAPMRGLSGSANLTVLVKFVLDQPLLPWQGKLENFSRQEIRSVERGICPIATLYLSLPLSCPVGSTQNVKIQ